MQWISQLVSEHCQKLVFAPVAAPENIYIVLQLRFHLFALSNIDVHAREARPPALWITFEATDTRQPSLSARGVLDAKFRVPIRARSVQLPYRVGHTIADRKSTRLNSSHPSISYAVFCLKKKT